MRAIMNDFVIAFLSPSKRYYYKITHDKLRGVDFSVIFWPVSCSVVVWPGSCLQSG